MRQHRWSINQTAAHFNIPAISSVSAWEKLYDHGKIEVPSVRRGRPKTMAKASPPSREAAGRNDPSGAVSGSGLLAYGACLSKKARCLDSAQAIGRKEQAEIIAELRPYFLAQDLIRASGIPKSSFYYGQLHVNACDRYSTEKALIHEIYHKHKGRYGYRRIDLVLRQTGYLLNHKTVQKLMGELKLKSVVRVKKYKSYRGQVGQSAPNHLARKFEANRPNEKWVTDVTEFNIAGQKVYLSPVLDLFNREIVSFTVDKRPHAHLIPNMLLKALKKLKHDGEFLWHTQIRVLLHQEIYRCRGLH